MEENSIFNYISEENNAKIYYDKDCDIDENEQLKRSNILSNIDDVSSIIILKFKKIENVDFSFQFTKRIIN